MAFARQETDMHNMNKPFYQFRDMCDALQHYGKYKTVTVSCTKTMHYVLIGYRTGVDISHHVCNLFNVNVHTSGTERKENPRKDYAFRRQCNEKPSTILGCPGIRDISVH